jgi:hypothetical protein
MSRYLHLRTSSNRLVRRPRIGPSRLSAIILLGAMSTVITAFGLPMGAASAASTPRVVAPRVAVPRVAVPQTSTFCGYAANAAKSTSPSASAAGTAASIQASFTKLKSEETFILANSPSQLKGDFTTLFSYLNKFIAILASVKYNFSKLTLTQEKAFSSADTKQVQAAVKAINTYLTNVCHVKSA